MKPGLDVCPIPLLGFQDCPTDNYSVTGKALWGQVIDFTPSVVQPYWALGFEFMTNAYPNKVYVEQAFYFSSLQLYRCSQVDTVTAQMNDSYLTSEGLVQTAFQIKFDQPNKKIYIQNLTTQLPQQSAPRGCAEILTRFWRATVFNFAALPGAITLPYQ